MANLKTGVTRKQSRLNFSKRKHFLPSDAHTYECAQGIRNVYFFWKIWRALFSCNTSFEILPFAVLLTIKTVKTPVSWEEVSVSVQQFLKFIFIYKRFIFGKYKKPYLLIVIPKQFRRG